MAISKPQPKRSDRSIPYIVVGALVVVLIGFAIAWFYFKQNDRVESKVAYAAFGPIVVRGSDFSIRATVTVQTGNDHAEWLSDNQKQLDAALQSALTRTDSVRVRKPDGMLYLQDMLRDATNGALQTKNIQEILVTDFVIQAN